MGIYHSENLLKPKMSSSDETLFITQSTFTCDSNADGPMFDFINPDFSDISDSQLVFATQAEEPDFSDISESELVSATQAAEEMYVRDRFAQPMKKGDLDNLVQKGLSKSTESKTKWAISLFRKWQTERTTKMAGGAGTSKGTLIYSCGIENMPDDMLSEALSYFVAEVRNQSGEEYRPSTLYELVVAIQHHLRKTGRLVSVLDDDAFEGMRRVLDAKMKELSSRGIGIDRKRADVISDEQEEILWTRQMLGTDTPQRLLDTVVFQLGLHFALRAGREHRNLRVGDLGQLAIHTDKGGNRYLEYREDVSKTNAGGLKHRRIEPKVTRAYENRRCPERCPVKIYEKYISLRPKVGSCTAFYLRPKKLPTSTQWYDAIPVGIHPLQATVARLCKDAGFSGFYTNHSLRATAATRLYEAGVDEQLICEKTGHRSNAIRGYKRTSDLQQKGVSDIVQANLQSKQLKLDDNLVAASTSTCVDEQCHKEINIEVKGVRVNVKF